MNAGAARGLAPVLAGAVGFAAAVLVAACGSQSTTSSTTASDTTTTVLTAQVVGTNPTGQRVTVTRSLITTPTDAPQGVTIQPGTPLGAATATTVAVEPVTVLSGTVTSTTVQTKTNAVIHGQEIDGILCARLDQLAYQAYAYLRVYVDGHAQQLPGGIGLVSPQPQREDTVTAYNQTLCAYWIHTEAANGVISMRAPNRRSFTLGDFFDVWGQPLSPDAVGPARGKVTLIVNGRRVSGDPRGLTLHEHDSIELAVGDPVPRFRPFDWAHTEL